MRRRARVDGPHKAITQALRKVGCRVFDASRCGSGFPDLVVRINGSVAWTAVGQPCVPSRVLLMEVKTQKGKLTREQHKFILEFPETVIVRSVEEALKAVGIV